LVSQRIVGEHHLKLQLTSAGSPAVLSAIAFNTSELPGGNNGQQVNVVYRLDVNEFRDVRQHQLLVEHIECV
jgi:single-stranded-DNA-specific exonuclease